MHDKIIDQFNCYVDLHLHLDGSLSINTVKKLMEMNNITTTANLHSLLEVGDNDKDLNDFLKKFDFPIKLLQTSCSIEYAVNALLEELASNGLMYAEIRFAPLNHMKCGLSIEDAVKAAIKGLNESKIPSNLILCMMRGADYQLNKETIDIAHKYLGRGVSMIDLAGAEALYPTRDYKELFMYAKTLGVPYTIHAGEADDFTSVKDAISFGAKRIGHGVRALEDRKTMDELISNDIVLEVCPTSNICTKIYKDIKDYPFKELIDSKIKFTINTDDMTVCRTNIKKEFKLFNSVYNLDLNLFKQIIKTSIDASGASLDIKNNLKEKLDMEVSL